MNKRTICLLALASYPIGYQMLTAQESAETPRTERQEQRQEQRQEAREERQETRQEARQENSQERAEQSPQKRQEARQENRQERRAERQQRIQQRLDNRSPYYDTEALNELDPWITRNNVTPGERVSRIAGAAVNATERALNTVTNATNAVDASGASTRYGYLNPNAPGEAGWFYDYYSYSPTAYDAPASGSTVYGLATRYYDLNGDGVYDNLNIFRDSDNNASYDVYDRYDFAATEDGDKQSGAEALTDSPEDANRYTVTGKIFASKSAKVNGVESLIVRLSDTQEKDGVTIVDVGPLEAWKNRSYKAGDQLTATGPVERVGEKRILIADTVTLGDQKEIQIARGTPSIEGQIVDVTKTKVKGSEHTIAVIESDSKRQLIDLGPAAKLKVKLEPETKIAVRGVPVRAGKHSIVQAEQITIDGETTPINRWQR